MEVNTQFNDLNSLINKDQFCDDWKPNMGPPPLKRVVVEQKVTYNRDLIRELLKKPVDEQDKKQD